MKRSRPAPIRRATVFLLVTAAAVVGCAGGSSQHESATTRSPVRTTVPVDTLVPPTLIATPETTVLAIDNEFEPKHIQVRVGTAVTFRNIGHNRHNIIPIDAAAPDFSVPDHEFPTGSSFTVPMDEPGTWAYYCSLHSTPTAGSMRGVVTVVP